MIRLKKLVCMSVIAVQLFSYSYTYAENEYADMSTVFSADFEQESADADIGSISGSVRTESVSTECGKSMQVSSANGGKIVYFMPSEVKPAYATLINLELYCTVNNVRGYFELLSEDADDESKNYYDRYKRIVYVRENGEIAAFNGWSGGDAQAGGTSYEAKNWQKITVWIDYENKKCYCYCNGNLLGMLEFEGDYESFAGIRYVLENTNGGGVHYIDNIRIYNVNETGKKLNIDSTTPILEGLCDFANVSFSAGLCGNNVFGKKADPTVTVMNRTNEDKEFEVSLKIFSDDGVAEFSEKKRVKVESNRTGNVQFSFVAGQYGFYNVNVAIIDIKSGERLNKKSNMQVINAPENKNPRMGIANHEFKNDEKMRLFRNMGMSYVREEISWDSFEREPGKYALSEYSKKLLEGLSESDMKQIAIMAFSNPNVTDESPPVSDSAIEAYANYCKKAAEATRDYEPQFEIWNEYNMKGSFFNVSGADEKSYVKMQKAAYTKIKEAAPDAVVYGLGGVTNVANFSEWIGNCFKEGALDYCDAISIHPYEFYVNPEESGSINNINEVKTLLEKYNEPDKEILASEFGWGSDTVGEIAQAQYTVRYYAMAGNLLDKITWYEAQDTADSHKFGWIREADETVSAPYEPFSAKPIALAMSNYNALLTGAENCGRVDIGDDSIYAYKFKTSGGEDCYMLWTTSLVSKNIGIKTSAQLVNCYDMYGNETALAAEDGVLSIEICGSPKYIIGNIGQISLDKSKFNLINNEINSVAGDTFSFKVNTTSDGDYETEVILPENVTLKNNSGFKNKSAEISLYSGTNTKENGEIKVVIKRSRDQKIVYNGEVAVKYTDAVRCKILPTYFRSGRWQLEIELENMKLGDSVSGEVKITAPESLAGTELDFENILPNSKKYLKVAVPENHRDVKLPVELTITLSDGESIKVSDTVYTTGFVYTKSPPEIDGIIGRNEWDKSVGMEMKYESQIKEIQDWGGNSDLSGTVYCMYDSENFYMTAEINDDTFCDTDSENRLYACDSIQFAFANERTKSGKRTEYAIGSLNGKPTVTRYFFMTVDTTITGVKDTESYDDIELAVRRDEEKKATYYEMKVPWNRIYGKNINPRSYKTMYFSVMVNDNDGLGRRGWIEFCPGIGSAKDASLFMEAPLGR